MRSKTSLRAAYKGFGAGFEKMKAENARMKVEIQQLVNALNAMLVGTDETLPEDFPGQTKAYLRIVAIPRARAAISFVKEGS